MAVVQARAAVQGHHAARELVDAAGAGAGGEAHWGGDDGGAATAKAASAEWGGWIPAVAAASGLRFLGLRKPSKMIWPTQADR